jgi:hypothetical protein
LAIPLPDGRLLLPDLCVQENLAEARAYVLEEAQYRWDEEHLDAAAA